MTEKPVPARQSPTHVTIEGSFGRLEPLDALRHGDDLWRAVSGANEIWTYLPYGPWQDQAAFVGWLDQRQSLSDPLSFAVCDVDGRAVGCLSLMEIRPQHGVIEIGHVLFSPRLQRTRLATELFFLLLRHVFDELGFRRCEWKCNNANAASKSAALRLGFRPEGIFRQHMIVKGANRDTAWFAMLDEEWPHRRRAFLEWLSPDNFTEDGQQIRSLSRNMVV